MHANHHQLQTKQLTILRAIRTVYYPWFHVLKKKSNRIQTWDKQTWATTNPATINEPYETYCTNKHEANIPEFHYMILLHGQILPLAAAPKVVFSFQPDSSSPKIPGEGGSLTIFPIGKDRLPTMIFQGL